MKYHIKNDSGDIIASFVNECDRDYCQDALSDVFDDCKFFAYTDEE
ncbi:hypothetical protein LCGC14_2868610 [marine sediment metagenome]|uniref:Uncharacterized protein n=1 Tax=marine sediment metagenome TaxID=412755 RepID=A0A0F9ABW0_9ZZZZ